MNHPQAPIGHDTATQRFHVDIDGTRAFCDYRLDTRDGRRRMLMTHTEVPPALGGRGIAATLVAEALAWARREGLAVVPLCSYVAAYMRRHPETQDLLAAP